MNNLSTFNNELQPRHAHGTDLSKRELNGWNTELLVLNIMDRVARQAKLDIHNDAVADELYWICCSLESWPEGEGFGSSDSYGFLIEAERTFHIPQEKQS